MVGMSHEFSQPGLTVLYGTFWAQHEILKICKQYFSSKPKEDLNSDSVSVHCFIIFWQPLEKEKCTGKVRDQWIFQTKKWDLQERDVLFKETTKSCTNISVQIFMIVLVFVQNRVYWKKALVLYNTPILSSELWHIQYCPVSLKI